MYLQRRAEDRLMAESRRYQATLRQASQGMTLIKELGKLLNLITHLLTQKVRVKYAVVYLWDERIKRFSAKASRQWEKKEPPTFVREDPLLEYLNWQRTALVTEELQLQVKAGQTRLIPVLESLKSMEAAVLVPSFVENNCLGFLVLGEKKSGALYTSDDLAVFQVLANQAALAIENAQFYEELKRTQADLFQTGKMASLGHMAGGMSHQINNRFHVLTILAGAMKATLKSLDPSAVDRERLKELWAKNLEVFEKIEENALRGGEIVKTLLKFSRPAGEYKAIAVKEVLATAKEISQFRVNFAALEVLQEVPEDLPMVRGDLNQLADCCFNLMSNAYDAMQKKGDLIQRNEARPGPKDPVPFKGRLKLKAWAEWKQDKRWVLLEVSDNGLGMSDQDLQNLFIPFFTTKATSEKGTGLGLYIIHRILEQHGGTITASSVQGTGTTFLLRLPALEGGNA